MHWENPSFLLRLMAHPGCGRFVDLCPPKTVGHRREFLPLRQCSDGSCLRLMVRDPWLKGTAPRIGPELSDSRGRETTVRRIFRRGQPPRGRYFCLSRTCRKV